MILKRFKGYHVSLIESSSVFLFLVGMMAYMSWLSSYSVGNGVMITMKKCQTQARNQPSNLLI
jgi:hypothetical protein